MSKMKEEFCRQQDMKALQPDAPDDSDYNAPTEYAQITGGDWRPDDWLNENGEPKISHPLYEAGASAMLNALLKWLDEPCRNEKHLNNPVCPGHLDFAHKNCPQCMKQLKENNGQ